MLLLTLASLSRRERRLLSRLWEAGAVSPERAHPLPNLPRAPAGWKDRLAAHGLLTLDPDGRGYINVHRYRPALHAWRGLLLGAALTLGVLGLWIFNQA
jgi:hypothetical protein